MTVKLAKELDTPQSPLGGTGSLHYERTVIKHPRFSSSVLCIYRERESECVE